jgi:hypothetical protein
MEVRDAHPDEGVDHDPEAPGQFAEPTEEPAPAGVGAEDALAAVAGLPRWTTWYPPPGTSTRKGRAMPQAPPPSTQCQ